MLKSTMLRSSSLLCVPTILGVLAISVHALDIQIVFNATDFGIKLNLYWRFTGDVDDSRPVTYELTPETKGSYKKVGELHNREGYKDFYSHHLTNGDRYSIFVEAFAMNTSITDRPQRSNLVIFDHWPNTPETPSLHTGYEEITVTFESGSDLADHFLIDIWGYIREETIPLSQHIHSESSSKHRNISVVITGLQPGWYMSHVQAVSKYNIQSQWSDSTSHSTSVLSAITDKVTPYSTSAQARSTLTESRTSNDVSSKVIPYYTTGQTRSTGTDSRTSDEANAVTAKMPPNFTTGPTMSTLTDSRTSDGVIANASKVIPYFTTGPRKSTWTTAEETNAVTPKVTPHFTTGPTTSTWTESPTSGQGFTSMCEIDNKQLVERILFTTPDYFQPKFGKARRCTCHFSVPEGDELHLTKISFHLSGSEPDCTTEHVTLMYKTDFGQRVQEWCGDMQPESQIITSPAMEVIYVRGENGGGRGAQFEVKGRPVGDGTGEQPLITSSCGELDPEDDADTGENLEEGPSTNLGLIIGVTFGGVIVIIIVIVICIVVHFKKREIKMYEQQPHYDIPYRDEYLYPATLSEYRNEKEIANPAAVVKDDGYIIPIYSGSGDILPPSMEANVDLAMHRDMDDVLPQAPADGVELDDVRHGDDVIHGDDEYQEEIEEVATENDIVDA